MPPVEAKIGKFASQLAKSQLRFSILMRRIRAGACLSLAAAGTSTQHITTYVKFFCSASEWACYMSVICLRNNTKPKKLFGASACFMEFACPKWLSLNACHGSVKIVGSMSSLHTKTILVDGRANIYGQHVTSLSP